MKTAIHMSATTGPGIPLGMPRTVRPSSDERTTVPEKDPFTAEELKDALEDYGDHLEVKIALGNGENEQLVDIDLIDDANTADGPVIVLRPRGA